MHKNNKISNRVQIGGIETAVLDNGIGRGVRIATVNTGTPLRYKVIIDRAMDIGDAFYSQHCLSWISKQGISAPIFSDFKGLEWLRSFNGGLVVTCGLSHVGVPSQDGKDGLHGRISNLPAEIVAVDQPDPGNGKMEMSITGIVRESSTFGPHIELKRTISGRLGESFIKINDTVTNIGNTPAPHMLLYHCNLGWPLIDKGTKLFWQGKCDSRGLPADNKIFNEENDYTVCPDVMPEHFGFGEACAFILPVAGDDGLCRIGAFNKDKNLKLTIEFDAQQLPCVTNWQHWGAGEYVTGLEPGTNFPVGREVAEKEGNLIMLAPGENRQYEIVIRADG